jgi:hypothetical protein
MAKTKHLYKICRNLVPSAFKVLQEERFKSNRVKLTHFWLAEQLGISNLVAFHLLQILAKKRMWCVQMPSGPIFWENEVLPVADIMRMMIPQNTK